MSDRAFSLPVRLRRAVRQGDVRAVRELLDNEGADPNDSLFSNLSLLAAAAEEGRSEVAEVLVERGADLGWRTAEGWTAATFADAAEFYGLADRLVELGVPEESRWAHGYSPLHRAARRGDLAAVKALASSETVNSLDARGDTPLALAIQFRHEAVASELISMGADPNHLNGEWSLLADAAYQDSVQDKSTRFVDLLIEAGADPNPDGYPPLHNAVNQEGESIEVMQRLAAAGADIRRAAAADGETILHRIAWISSDPEMVDACIDLGASIEARDSEGRTPVLCAACGANLDTFSQLARRGADLNAQDAQGHGIGDLLDESPLSTRIREIIASR